MPLTRRMFLAGAGLGAPLIPAAEGRAQTTAKVWKIGWLSPAPVATGASELEALRVGLRRSRPDALMTTADPLLASYRQPVVEFWRPSDSSRCTASAAT
jgi:hypothetical protein